MIKFYTDGSYRKSEDKGGFGVVGLHGQDIVYIHQEQKNNVTNNQMELMGIIHACKVADERYPQEEVIIYSDSAYCVNAINEWMYNWSKNGWINSKHEPVKNLDLMQQLYKIFMQNFYHCAVMKVKGHDGVPENELADALAIHDANKFIKVIQENNFNLVEEYL